MTPVGTDNRGKELGKGGMKISLNDPIELDLDWTTKEQTYLDQWVELSLLPATQPIDMW